MITLHDKSFSTLYGTLSTFIEAFVIEERNGIFEFEGVMINNDTLFSNVKEGNIIKCHANYLLLEQKFRIYNTRKLMNNRVEVYARHISFDLMYDYIDSLSFENQSCEYALNRLFRLSNFSTHYKGYSDIVNAQNYNISNVNLLSAIGGTEGSILDTFGNGAEILRDNENIHVLNRRGNDNSVTIEYKKNLTGFELEEDTTDLVTRILPYAKYTPEDGEETTVKASYVDSPLINNYSHPFIKAIDYSDKFEDKEVPTIEKLIQFAQLEYTVNKVDIPKQNFKIEFIPLSKTVGYEALNDNISLCDTVTIIDNRYNINTQAKVIKTVFNVLKNRYESIELGEPRTSLGDVISSSSNDKVTEEQVKDIVASTPSTNYPNTLPTVPVLKYFVYGFANIELRWTFENKVFYAYEVYASKTRGFTPNTFDLIYQGQASSYMFQAQPNETWYFKVCGVNSYNRRTEFSNEVEVVTTKISDLSNYVANMAIGEALIGELNLGRGWVGQLNANLLDVKGNFSVTDGNGRRTFDIDSFGNINIQATTLKMLVDGVVDNVATSSQVEQKVDSVEFKFTQSGGYNLLRNSAFKNGYTNWYYQRWDNSAGGNSYIEVVEPTFSEWTPSNRNSLSACINGLSSSSAGQLLRTGFDSHKFTVKPNTTYTLNCLMAGHRIRGWTIEMICYDSDGNRLLDNNHAVVINNNNYFGGRDRNNWAKIKHTWTTQINAATCHLRAYMNEWTGELDSAFLWICEPVITEGDVEVLWTPNADELYTGITTIDEDGAKVQHDAGSYSRFSSKELYQTNESGDRSLSLRYGALRAYQFNKNNNNANGFLGGVSSVFNTNINTYGISIFGSAHSAFTDFGFSESLEDNQHSGISSWLRCVHYANSIYPEAGIYTFKPLHIKHYSYFHYRPRMIYGINFPYEDDSLNEEISYIVTNANASAGTRYLCLYGADGIEMGVQNNGNFIGHRMVEDFSAAKLHHDVWGDWNFNGWAINNARVTSSLSNPIAELNSRERQFTRESHAMMSTVRLIQERGEDFTLDGQCIVEIPDDIKYNINKYDVNIIKYGKGDIWVSRREYDYFVVESDNDIKFTWVLEGQLIESTTRQITPYQYLSDEDISCTSTIDDVNSIPASKFSVMDDEEIERFNGI